MRALWLALVLSACNPVAKTGPVEIKWDRDQCTGCGMVISEPHFAAEIRGGPQKTVAKFDDVGCAAKWLERQAWANEPSTEIWVARQSDGTWLDARAARYLGGKSSPMGYGFSAVDPGGEGLTLEAMREQLRTQKH